MFCQNEVKFDLYVKFDVLKVIKFAINEGRYSDSRSVDCNAPSCGNLTRPTPKSFWSLMRYCAVRTLSVPIGCPETLHVFECLPAREDARYNCILTLMDKHSNLVRNC
jgi:hypothetical protein